MQYPEGVKFTLCPPNPAPPKYTALPKGTKLRSFADPSHGRDMPGSAADVYRCTDPRLAK